MFFWIITSFLFILFLIAQIVFTKKVKTKLQNEQLELDARCNSSQEKQENIYREFQRAGNFIEKRFLFYDTARKISPLLDEEKLLFEFSEEIKRLGTIEDIVYFKKPAEDKDYFKFTVSEKDNKHIYVKTKSKFVIEYFPYFFGLLKLCLERIELYNQLQKLSIHDSLTKIYNRRYFMQRFFEEFQRAKRFNLDLSFLMIDVDHFKKINDTYGHLVGDAVLKEIANMLNENLRGIDFVGRYGGEEFSALLIETDKAGAIMVAERLCSRISCQRINVFDESLSLNVSVGVASFPQNTLYSDVLVEIADKALYKAKLLGRNKVCWF